MNRKLVFVGFMLFLITAITCSIIAQDVGQLVIHVFPKEGSIIKLDGKILAYETKVEQVTVGEHRVQAWNTGMKLFDTTLVVTAEKIVILKKILQPTPEYEHWLDTDLAKYQLAEAKRGSAKLIGLIGLGVITTTAITRERILASEINKLEEEAKELEENYVQQIMNESLNFTINRYEEIQAEHVSKVDKYDKWKTVSTIGVGVATLANIAIWTIYKKPIKPSYEDQSPFSLKYHSKENYYEVSAKINF